MNSNGVHVYISMAKGHPCQDQVRVVPSWLSRLSCDMSVDCTHGPCSTCAVV